MSQSAKKEYFSQIWERYQKGSRLEKGRILDEFCKVCGYSRNYAIRKLRGPLNAPGHKRGRKPSYDGPLIQELVKIWNSMCQCCSKKMVAALPYWINHLDLDVATQTKLLRISSATIDRLLQPYRNKQIRGKSLTYIIKSPCQSRVSFMPSEQGIVKFYSPVV